MKKKDNIIIYNTIDWKTSVVLYAKQWDIWMNQNQIAELFDTSISNISIHTKNIFEEWELSQKSVIKDYLTTASDWKNYNVNFYSLKMILAIWFRVKSVRWIQFRKWAIENIEEFMIKGFIIDDERLKNPDWRSDYFDELLARIRDIRSSEKRFYQKVRDLFRLSSDYDKTDKATEMFFTEVQNKILYAITGKTASEIIISRVDGKSTNMNLTSWKWKVVRKQDIYISKNYLTEDEIDDLNRFVTIFLETAEFKVKKQEDITLKFWRENINSLIVYHNKKLLIWKWKISNKQMKEKVKKIYEKYDKKRKKEDLILEDKKDLLELDKLEKNIKSIIKN
jgi:hypothetical protein